MAVGTVLRYDEIRGYGFISPEAGGDDVFVHANDFGQMRHRVHPGLRVEYDVEQGDRGLKVASVRIVDRLAGARGVRTDGGADGGTEGGTRPVGADDEGMCDVLTWAEYNAELTETLLQRVPSLTAAQICEIRTHLAGLARNHGWVES